MCWSAAVSQLTATRTFRPDTSDKPPASLSSEWFVCGGQTAVALNAFKNVIRCSQTSLRWKGKGQGLAILQSGAGGAWAQGKAEEEGEEGSERQL